MSAAWVPDTYCETHEWRSAQGDVIRFVTRTEATQRMIPPVTITTIRVPQAQGGAFRGARHEERIATIPVVAPGPTDGRDELRRWATALDPLQGEGTLTVVQGAHAGRQLVCIYETGLEDLSEEWPSLGLITLGFHASEPYWQDSVDSSISAGVDSAAYKWFPFLPLVLGASDVFAVATIHTLGDVEAWPIVTVTGPGSDLTVSNTTTGLSWNFTGAINAGSTLVVDTRPGHKAVRLDGFNAFGRLSDHSVLWPLVPGVNQITIGFAGAGSASKVEFAWRNRYLSA